MKRILSLLLCFCTFLLFAQSLIFQNPVSPGSLQPHQKLHDNLASSYVATTYYEQPSFDLTADLSITLVDGKKIRAKPAKTFKYTNRSISFSYAIENEPDSELVFSKYDDMLSGMYASSAGEKIMFQ